MTAKSQPRSAKSGERRAHLAAAASRVMRRGGMASASVRAVAEEASVSVGSVLYYYESLDELLRVALTNVLDEFHGRRLHVIASADPPPARLARMIELGVPDVIGEDLGILYESITFARSSPERAPLHSAVVERQVDLYRTLLRVGVESGDFHARSPVEMIARNLVALEDAYDLYPLIGLELTGEQRRANIRSYAEDALGCWLP